MKKIFLVVLLFIAFSLFCNEPPVVSNVVVEQRNDGTYFVDIYYDLEDTDGDNMMVSISASDDEGESWDYPIISLSGDTGYNITSGNNKQIIWDFATDHPEVLNIPTMIKVTADDRDISGIEGMVFVQGGTFEMGDHFNEGSSDELPVHEITLNSFYIGQYEVTQGEYESVMGSNPANGYGVGENYPIYNVTWYDAVEYCNVLSIQYGRTPCYDLSDWSCDFSANGYRLLTEAEWEYAARGGVNWTDDYRYSGCHEESDLVDYAIYISNDPGHTEVVGSKLPNQLDIYDMSGNVYEWCNDWYSSDYYSSSPADNPTGPDSEAYRITRGGGWLLNANSCRVANRNSVNPSSSYYGMGFRILRALN